MKCVKRKGSCLDPFQSSSNIHETTFWKFECYGLIVIFRCNTAIVVLFKRTFTFYIHIEIFVDDIVSRI